VHVVEVKRAKGNAAPASKRERYIAPVIYAQLCVIYIAPVYIYIGYEASQQRPYHHTYSCGPAKMHRKTHRAATKAVTNAGAFQNARLNEMQNKKQMVSSR
jgi:hypothetical protein